MRPAYGTALLSLLLLLPEGVAAQTLHGRITDKSGRPLPSATVRLEDQNQRALLEVRASGDGSYEIVAPQPGVYRLLFLCPGYRPLLAGPIDLAARQTKTVAATLISLSAVGLDTVVTEGERVPPYLEVFYRRQHTQAGTFLTEQAIEKYTPTRTTDLAYHLPGFRLAYDAHHRRIITHSRHNGLCPPLVFVDGLFVGDTKTYDLDDVAPQDIAAMEAYAREAATPVELNRQGSACGVLVVWTKH